MSKSSKSKVKYPKLTECALWILILLTLWLILGASMKTGAESGSISHLIYAKIEPVLEKLGIESFYTETALRKTAHFTEFMLLGIELSILFRLVRPKPWSVIALVGVLTALSDETLQLFSPGRGPAVLDVWIDFAGIVTAMGLIYIVCEKSRK